MRAVIGIGLFEFFQLDIGDFGGVTQHGDAADLQRQRRVARHAPLDVVILIRGAIHAAGGDQRIGRVYRRGVGYAETQ